MCETHDVRKMTTADRFGLTGYIGSDGPALLVRGSVLMYRDMSRDVLLHVPGDVHSLFQHLGDRLCVDHQLFCLCVTSGACDMDLPTR